MSTYADTYPHASRRGILSLKSKRSLHFRQLVAHGGGASSAIIRTEDMGRDFLLALSLLVAALLSLALVGDLLFEPALSVALFGVAFAPRPPVGVVVFTFRFLGLPALEGVTVLLVLALVPLFAISYRD